MNGEHHWWCSAGPSTKYNLLKRGKMGLHAMLEFFDVPFITPTLNWLGVQWHFHIKVTDGCCQHLWNYQPEYKAARGEPLIGVGGVREKNK